MLKKIEDIKNKSITFIRDFIKNCTIEEKIDAHYVSITIISKNEIQIKKSNGNIINRIDLILNSMWNKLVLDWNYLHLTNKEWFDTHIGYTITMFYLPCNKPILTEYQDNLRYIFDEVIYNNVKYDHFIMNDLVYPKTYDIGFKHNLKKIENINEYINAFDSNIQNISNYFYNLIYDADNVFTNIKVNKPEGFIFKWNNNIYQIANNNNRQITAEKTSYEFLLCDFIKYCKDNKYKDKIVQGYTKTVCNLFNDYIINWEKINTNIQKNINVNSIESPYLGTNFDIGYDYIPDPITKNICSKNILYKNIFKVLLANLKKGKDIKRCIFMNKQQVEDWNIIVKNIKIHTVYI